MDINKIIKTVLGLRAYEQKVNNIKVNTQFDPDLPEVIADGFQLQQVFINIIINAEHFMIEAHGRGMLNITTERVENTIKASFADEAGAVTDMSVELYRRLGEGDIGLIVSSFAFVSPHGQAIRAQYGIYADEMIPGLRRMAKAAQQDGTKVAAVVQSGHHLG